VLNHPLGLTGEVVIYRHSCVVGTAVMQGPGNTQPYVREFGAAPLQCHPMAAVALVCVSM
jgi:hypothetical protein